MTLSEELRRRISDAMDSEGGVDGDVSLAAILKDDSEAREYMAELRRLDLALRHWPEAHRPEIEWEAMAASIESKLGAEMFPIGDITRVPVFDVHEGQDSLAEDLRESEPIDINMAHLPLPPPTFIGERPLGAPRIDSDPGRPTLHSDIEDLISPSMRAEREAQKPAIRRMLITYGGLAAAAVVALAAGVAVMSNGEPARLIAVQEPAPSFQKTAEGLSKSVSVAATPIAAAAPAADLAPSPMPVAHAPAEQGPAMPRTAHHAAAAAADDLVGTANFPAKMAEPHVYEEARAMAGVPNAPSAAAPASRLRSENLAEVADDSAATAGRGIVSASPRGNMFAGGVGAGASSRSAAADSARPPAAAQYAASAPAPAPSAPVAAIPSSSAAHAAPSRENSAREPSVNGPPEVRAAFESARAAVTRCGADIGGYAPVTVVVNEAGHATNVDVGGAFAGTNAGACIVAAVRRVSFPHGAASASYRFVYSIPGPAAAPSRATSAPILNDNSL